MAEPAQHFHPEHAIDEIADMLADPVEPARFPEHRLRWRNDRAAAEVGLDGLSDAEWIGHFGRFQPLPDAQPHPLALRYHGHQFRVYNADIGDGRGFLFAQCRDAFGRLMDFGTKGSGQTPYSRFGDGRLTLKGAVREILATEMLEALGVPTSRTFSVIETGESLHRGDEPSPTRGAVLVRLNHGHIRIGSFQRLAALGDTAALARLTDYCLRHYYGETTGGAARLLHVVAERTATMAAAFMSAGFVHGVLNSDNINITGESFDYGPWRFAPTFDPAFTAAYFDSAGLYAFGRQPEAIQWNVGQLARALSLIADEAALIEAMRAFVPAYRNAVIAHMLRRLCVSARGATEDAALVHALETALHESQIGLDAFFFDWAGGRLKSEAPEYDHPAFAGLRATIADYSAAGSLDDPYWQGAGPCTMLIEDVEAVWAAIATADDWQPLHAKLADIAKLRVALAKANKMAKDAA